MYIIGLDVIIGPPYFDLFDNLQVWVAWRSIAVELATLFQLPRDRVLLLKKDTQISQL